MLTSESSEASEIALALGSDLLALVRAQGVPLAKLSAITSLPSPVRTRAAYAIELADGTRLKGRRLKSEQRAEAVVRLRARVGAGFAPILARRGEAMLLAWIEGRGLASLDVLPASLLRHCGAWLGALHRLPAVPIASGTAASPGEHFAKLERNLALLLEAQLLDEDLARRALAAAEAARPETVSLGIIHKDYCPENLVLTADDCLVCVDDASLSTGPHDLDLARTWYRWPMQPGDAVHFAGGYQEHRSLADFLRHFRFWATCVVVASAVTRVRSHVPGARIPLERLRQLLAPA